jgi:thymidylate synthase
MTIHLIANVFFSQNKFAIGQNNQLLFSLKEDLQFFKNITTNSLKPNCSLNKNIIVMGYNTWCSIGSKPLPNRINVVLTRRQMSSVLHKDTYFMNFYEFIRFYNKYDKPNTFIIGGSQIYNLFLHHPVLFPQDVYLTHVTSYDKNTRNILFNVFFDVIESNYKLISFSEEMSQNDIRFRFLKYRHRPCESQEKEYIELITKVLSQGIEKPDRTGVGTKSIFTTQLEFDISDCVPLLTTKRVPWKHVIHELLWFLRGDTNAKLLENNGVKIWNGNSSREFLDSRGLDYPEGVLGPIYGWQWRYFGAEYDPEFSDTSKEHIDIGGFDQIDYIITELKTNPHSRRLLVSAWNPSDFDKMSLPPCHFCFQFYVRETQSGVKFLDCHFNMRSTDVALGLPFNLFSYAALTYIIALKTDMKPGKLIYTGSDVHIYKNHVSPVSVQTHRNLRPFPKLKINPDVKSKDFRDISIDDFELIGYFPHGTIKMDMAV